MFHYFRETGDYHHWFNDPPTPISMRYQVSESRVKGCKCEHKDAQMCSQKRRLPLAACLCKCHQDVVHGGTKKKRKKKK